MNQLSYSPHFQKSSIDKTLGCESNDKLEDARSQSTGLELFGQNINELCRTPPEPNRQSDLLNFHSIQDSPISIETNRNKNKFDEESSETEECANLQKKRATINVKDFCFLELIESTTIDDAQDTENVETRGRSKTLCLVNWQANNKIKKVK